MAADVVNDVDSRKYSSREFFEQIRQLEIEGAKLQEATRTLGESLGGLPLLSPSNSTKNEPFITSRNLSSAMARLNTGNDNDVISASGDVDLYTIPLPPNLSNKLNMSAFKPFSSTGGDDMTYKPLGPSHDYAFSSQLTSQNSYDKQLLEAKAEINSLHNRLHETMTLSEQRKEQYKSNTEELRRRLQDCELGKETAIQKWQQEVANQEILTKKMQETMAQLDRANRLQEESLFHYNEKLDSLQREQCLVNSAVSQLRTTLSEREQQRGRPFYESEPVSKQNISMLVHTVERCLQELQAEVLLKSSRCNELKTELESLHGKNGERLSTVEREYEERLNQLKKEHNAELTALNEKLNLAKKQQAAADEQIQALRREAEQQMERKEALIRDQADQLKCVKTDYSDKWNEWKQKREALELAVDSLQKESFTLKSEKEDALRKCAAIESRFSHIQQIQTRLETELESERDKIIKLSDREREFVRKSEKDSEELRAKTLMIEHLEKILQSVRQEMQQQLQQTVSHLQKEGEGKLANEVSRITMQYESMTERCQKLAMELEVNKVENQGLREKCVLLTDTTDKLARQLEAEIQKKENLNAVLTDRLTDVEKLSREHARCCELLANREVEYGSLQLTCERLQVQLEEREKNFLMLKEQGDRVAALADASREESDKLREENNQLLLRVQEKATSWRDLKRIQDDSSKRIKLQERKLKDADNKIKQLEKELEILTEKFNNTLLERDSLLAELKQSRYEVASLSNDVAEMRARAGERTSVYQKEKDALEQHLKVVEKELSLAQQMLKMKDDISGKVVKVAGKMQKEVTEKRSEIDTVHSQLRIMEERLEAANKGNSLLRMDNEKLSTAVRQASEMNERLIGELKLEKQKTKELLATVSQLEQSIKKAGTQKAQVDCQMEKYEQDIARLKLKYQLQMKESEHNNNNRNLPIESVAVVSKYSPKPEIGRHGLVTSLKANSNWYPVSQKPTYKPSQSPPAKETDEAKHIIEEMKMMLQGHCQGHCQGHLEHCKDGHRLSIDDSDTIAESDENDTKFHSDGHLKIESSSPVANLLTQSCQSDEDIPLNSDASLSQQALFKQKKSSSYQKQISKTGNDKMNLDTAQLCKRLEKKICDLNSLGSKLKVENKDMAASMRRQERKLRQISEQLPK